MHRILVIGSGGSGKTTLATRLAAELGLPMVHLDAHYWRDGWQPTPADEWQATVRRLVQEPRWVMDGNYGGTLDLRLAAADTVVFLDISRMRCLWRVLVRRVRHHRQSRRSMAPGCPERLTVGFIKWIWQYPSRRRPDILRRLRQLGAGKTVAILRNDGEVGRFVRDLDSRRSRAVGRQG